MLHPDGIGVWIEAYHEKTRLDEHTKDDAANESDSRRRKECYIEGTPRQRFAIYAEIKSGFDYLTSVGIGLQYRVDMGRVRGFKFCPKPSSGSQVVFKDSFNQRVGGDWVCAGVCFGDLTVGKSSSL